MLKYVKELEEVRKVDKDRLLEDISKVYREGLQEVQDMKEEYGKLVGKRNEDGGRMMYKDYLKIVDKIEYLEQEIERQQLRNDGMENAREVVFDAEVIED